MPRIFAPRTPDRPWTEKESWELADAIHSEAFDAQKLNRSNEDCYTHWLDLLAIIFMGEVPSSDKRIIERVRKYYESLESEAGPSTGVSQRLSQTEAEKMIIQCLVDKEKINAGLSRTEEECKVCIGEIVVWLAKGRPTKDLVHAAISEYHRYQRDSKFGIEMTCFGREALSRASSGSRERSL